MIPLQYLSASQVCSIANSYVTSLFDNAVPETPTGFNISEVYFIVGDTTITFKWDPPQGVGPEAIVDYYVIAISPAPLSHPILNNVSSSPWNVTVAYNTGYSVNITAVNCAGRSGTFVLADFEYSTLFMHAHSEIRVFVLKCILVNCGVPGTPTNGSVNDHPHTRVGISITYQCNEGFRPSAVFTSVCDSSAQWIPDPATLICEFVIGMFL